MEYRFSERSLEAFVKAASKAYPQEVIGAIVMSRKGELRIILMKTAKPVKDDQWIAVTLPMKEMREIKTKYGPRLVGLIHSHPDGDCAPSSPDLDLWASLPDLPLFGICSVIPNKRGSKYCAIRVWRKYLSALSIRRKHDPARRTVRRESRKEAKR